MDEQWKKWIDYGVWILTTMDDEESRILDCPEPYLEEWKREGVSEEDMQILTKHLDRIRHPYDPEEGLLSNGGEDRLWAEMLTVLKKYMTHRELYEQNIEAWSRLYFGEGAPEFQDIEYCPVCGHDTTWDEEKKVWVCEYGHRVTILVHD